FRHSAPRLSSISDAWGRLNVVTPFHHLSGDSHLHRSLGAGPITASSPTLAELLMPLPAANPFSTMLASLRWYSSEELEDGVTYGRQSWLRRGFVDSFFSALLLRDGDAAGRRKRSSS